MSRPWETDSQLADDLQRDGERRAQSLDRIRRQIERMGLFHRTIIAASGSVYLGVFEHPIDNPFEQPRWRLRFADHAGIGHGAIDCSPEITISQLAELLAPPAADYSESPERPWWRSNFPKSHQSRQYRSSLIFARELDRALQGCL